MRLIHVKHEPRGKDVDKRFGWQPDNRPYVVYVNGVLALDKRQHVRRFRSSVLALKAFQD